MLIVCCAVANSSELVYNACVDGKKRRISRTDERGIITVRTKIENKLAAVGVTRLTTAGHMSRTVSGEAHDGTYALREYSRIVETEVF